MNNQATVAFFFFIFLYSAGCSPSKNTTSPDNKQLPGLPSVTPQSFQCNASVLEMDSMQGTFLVGKILQQGSSLFYPVSAGDTITGKFLSRQKKIFGQRSNAILTVEERVTINSPQPEFIVRDIR